MAITNLISNKRECDNCFIRLGTVRTPGDFPSQNVESSSDLLIRPLLTGDFPSQNVEPLSLKCAFPLSYVEPPSSSVEFLSLYVESPSLYVEPPSLYVESPSLYVELPSLLICPLTPFDVNQNAFATPLKKFQDGGLIQCGYPIICHDCHSPLLQASFQAKGRLYFKYFYTHA